jgi:hypothetical protein
MTIDIRRREFLALLCGTAVAWPGVAQAQQERRTTPRIGTPNSLDSLPAKNWVTDFGVVPNDQSPQIQNANRNAASAFRQWARNQNPKPVHLLIPPGDYYMSDGNQLYNDNSQGIPFDGIQNLTVSAYGAVFHWPVRLTGSGGMGGLMPHVNTVKVGDTVAVFKNHNDIHKWGGIASYSYYGGGTGPHGPFYGGGGGVGGKVRFRPGQWCALTSDELQGEAGYPPNHHNIQFVQITAIEDDGVTAKIHFTPPAKHTFRDTLPTTYDIKVNPNDDRGGPAVLFLVGGGASGMTFSWWTAWDIDVTIMGLTVRDDAVAGNQVYCPGRKVTLIDCHFYGCAFIPTMNKEFTAIRCTTDSYEVELDKECETVEFRDCTLRSVKCQSSSVMDLIVKDTTVISYFGGTPRRLTMDGCTLNGGIVLGPQGYGQTESVNITNTTAIGVGAGSPGGYQLPITDFQYSKGRFTYIGRGIPPWAVPGLWYLGVAHPQAWLSYCYPFAVTDVVTDQIWPTGGRTVLVTNLPDPLPAFPVPQDGLGFITLNQNACPSVTASGLTGSPTSRDVNTAPPGLPMFSHCIGTYTGSPSETREIVMHGRLVSIRINVVKPYTGVTAASVIFNSSKYENARILHSNLGGDSFGWHINVKIMGERLLTPTSATGIQTGDGLTYGGTPAAWAAPGVITFTDTIGPSINYDLSNENLNVRPIVEFEMLTDQLG